MRGRRLALISCLATALLGYAPALLAQQDTLVRARSLATAGKLTESAGVLHRFIAANPSSADSYFLLGYVYFRERKPKQSLAAFTSGARFRRPAADDFKVIASDYVLLGDYADADKWFTEVTRETPGDGEAWYLLGRAQYNEDRFRESIASFEQALKLRPEDIRTENNLGLAWQGLNDVGKAMTSYRQAITWQSRHPVDAQPYMNLGIALTDGNRPREALPWLQQAARLAPLNPKAHEELARALENAGDLSEAQHELEKAAALAPNVSGLHFKLGRLYMREGLHDLAQRQFDICEKLNSTHSSIDTPNPYTPN